MPEVQKTVEEVFASVFGRSIAVTDDLSAKDVDDWDSLQHINLIVALEKRFNIRFATAEISRLKEDGQTAGTLLGLVRSKLAARG